MNAFSKVNVGEGTEQLTKRRVDGGEAAEFYDRLARNVAVQKQHGHNRRGHKARPSITSGCRRHLGAHELCVFTQSLSPMQLCGGVV